MAANVISLAFTVVFARVLGEDGYGSLIALVAAFLVLAIPGQAVQVAVAREVSREVVGHDPALLANVRGWTRALLIATCGLAVVSALARAPLSDLLGVTTQWGAAAILPMAGLWFLLCILRGVLLGVGSYLAVAASLIGEAVGRLAFALALVGAGAGPAGAFVGHGITFVVICLVLGALLARRLAELGAASSETPGESLGELLRRAGIPVVALGLFALLQNLDVLIVRSQATEQVASDYAAVSVAAKALIWLAIGLGMFLLPEASRRAEQGLDGRPMLARTLGLSAAAGLAATVIFALFGETILSLAFGDDLAQGSAALPWLTLAMALLAAIYLTVQFLLALRGRRFLLLLAVAVVAEAGALLAVGAQLTEVAIAVAGVDVVLFAAVALAAYRTGAPSRLREPSGPAPAPVAPPPVEA